MYINHDIKVKRQLPPILRDGYPNGKRSNQRLKIERRPEISILQIPFRRNTYILSQPVDNFIITAWKLFAQ